MIDSESIKSIQARPHNELIDEILDSRIAKTEREHAAAREIKNLKAEKKQLEKAKCCGSCKWWNYFVEEEGIETCCVISGVYGIWPSNYCDKWEVRE